MKVCSRAKRDADGLTRAQRIELMLDLLMISRQEVGIAHRETPLTLREIAAFLGVSFQQVQQTEQNAMRKLRHEATLRRQAGHPLFALLVD